MGQYIPESSYFAAGDSNLHSTPFRPVHIYIQAALWRAEYIYMALFKKSGAILRRVMHDVRGGKLLRGPPCTRRCRAVTGDRSDTETGEQKEHRKKHQ